MPNTNGPMPEMQTVNQVEIPKSNIVLEDDEMAILVLLVNPLDEDNNHGKYLFVNACEALEMILDARLDNVSNRNKNPNRINTCKSSHFITGCGILKAGVINKCECSLPKI